MFLKNKLKSPSSSPPPPPPTVNVFTYLLSCRAALWPGVFSRTGVRVIFDTDLSMSFKQQPCLQKIGWPSFSDIPSSPWVHACILMKQSKLPQNIYTHTHKRRHNSLLSLSSQQSTPKEFTTARQLAVGSVCTWDVSLILTFFGLCGFYCSCIPQH